MSPFWESGSHFRKILLLLSFLDTLSTRVGNSYGSNEAFIQSDSELRYLVDGGVSASFSEGISKDSAGFKDNPPGISVLGSPIRFEPSELDFSEQPLGLPVMRKILVHNLNSESSIQMLSISGNTIHFHCSFFADKVIPPSGNTSFDIVFLGREEGVVENTLYIHTSAGSFRFQVRAMGMPNPYRLKPLVGVKMPLNSSYSPLIEMHNPHSEPIQVLEMYSSGGDLHLELPSGETEGPQTLWQIPPYQTKSVMKANFVARLENNHTAYIRIKTNTTGAEFLYLPLEVEVSSQPGIYCPQELMDFGLLASNSEPRSLKLLVLNSGQKPIPIQNVIATPVTEAVSINFQSVKILPDTLQPTMIASVVFDPSQVSGDGLYTGKLVIKSKNNQFKVSIPYRARVVSGRLFVNESLVRFHLNDDVTLHQEMSRNLTVKNEFSVPVAVHGVSLAPAAANFMRISPFKTLILAPGESKDIVVLSLKEEVWNDRILDSHLVLHTNISNMNIPLICFHGYVNTFFPGSPSQDIIDFGTLGMGEKRDHFFAILNKNPVTINLDGWGSNLTGSVVELMGVDMGNESQILQRANFSNMARKFSIPPGHYMVFRISIQTPDEEGLTNATVFIDTNYHAFLLPLRFRVAKGSLHTVPRELIFDPVFPGKEVELKLKVFSSFTDDMITDYVYTIPNDYRFSFKHAVFDGRTVVMSGEKSFVGRVLFDPGALCRRDESCYSGFSLTSTYGREWYQGLTLQPSVGDSDVAIVHTLWNRHRMATSPSSSFNITLNLDTNQVRGFLFKARARLIWPVIMAKDRLTFSLTQVGNFSQSEIVLSNPSNQDVYFHLVPLAAYPNGAKVANLLPARIKNDASYDPGPFTKNSVSTFRVVSIFETSGSEPVHGIGEDLESRFGVALPPETKAFILGPGKSVKVTVRFQPDITGKFHQGLFVRNNLTGIEMVDLKGESVEGEIKFGKWKSSQTGHGVLEFDMKEKHLRDCDRSKHSRYSPPVLTVKRLFKAKNTGLTPVYISGFEIEGQPCEGHGFKVLNCDPFTVEPAQSIDVDIAFTPDFTLSKVTRTLTLQTSLSPEKRKINFTLQATVPAHMLFVCASVLPRPSWEPYLFYIINTFMVFILICVLITAVMEAERILKVTIGVPIHARATHLLDLRRVAQEVDVDMRQRIVGGIVTEDDLKTQLQQLQSPTPKPLEKKLLLSRLASRSVNVLVMPFTLSLSFAKKCLFVVKKSLFVFSWRRREVVEEADTEDQLSEDGDEIDLDELDEVDEEDDIEDGDDEGEEDQCSIQNDSNNCHDHTGQKSTLIISNATANRQHRSRKRQNRQNRPNLQNWRQKSVEFLVGSDDPCDSSSTCTESSVVEEDSHVASIVGNGSVPNKGSQRNKNKNNNCSRTPGLSKENSSAHINTSEATNNATTVINNNSKTNINNKKGNKKSTSNQQPTATVKPQVEEQPKLVNPTQSRPFETAAVKKPTAKTNKTPSTPTTTPTPVMVSPQQQQQAKQKVTVKQQAKVKPTEKPPRLSLSKSYSESEDRAENGSVASTPGPTTSTSGGSIFGPSSSVTTPAPLAPLSEALKQKTKVTPVGKILPEIKKPENLGAQFGPIGAKPPTMISTSSSGRKPTWCDGPADLRASHNNGMNNNNRMDQQPIFRNSPVDATQSDIEFGLRYQQHQQQQQQAFHAQQQQRLLNIDDITGGLGISSGLLESGSRLRHVGSAASNTSPTHSSLMQTLQYERRQRTEEFFSQHQPDWPGFGAQLPAENYLETLWDNPPIDQQADARLAGNKAVTSGWGNFSSIWPSSLWSTSVGLGPSSPPPPLEPLPTYNSRLPSAVPLQEANTNEYNNLASVWGETTSRQSPTQQKQLQQGLNPSWSSTLFSNHPHEE